MSNVYHFPIIRILFTQSKEKSIDRKLNKVSYFLLNETFNKCYYAFRTFLTLINTKLNIYHYRNSHIVQNI